MSSGTFGSCSGLASSVVGCCVCELARLLLAVRKLGKLVERGASSRIKPSVSAKDFKFSTHFIMMFHLKLPNLKKKGENLRLNVLFRYLSLSKAQL
jgi:hypothetical protein